jgi:hypothetical protein
MSDNLDINNTELVDSKVTNPVNTPVSSGEKSTSFGDNNPGLTSFSSEEVASPISNPVINDSVSPLENLAKKEVVTRPLLWGVVVFLFFFALVIGAAGLYRYYQDQNKPVQDAVVLPATTPTATTPAPTTQSSIDATPVSTDTKVQADVISAEIQSIDTDIEGDVLSDSSLGL